MLRKLRPSPAMIVACIALIVALGGTAWAVAANSVGTAQLKNGAVTNPKLAQGSVGTFKVIDGSLLKEDFKAGQLPKGDPGPPGPGAISFDDNGISEFGGFYLVGRYNGIDLTESCISGGSVVLGLRDSIGHQYIAATGTKHSDYGAPTSVDAYAQDVLFAGSSAAAASVIAKQEGVDKWTRFDLGSYHAGGKCNFWGMITPPSN
jgi:hypothetical protein